MSKKRDASTSAVPLDREEGGLDFVSELSPEEIAVRRSRLRSVSPDDGKYEIDSLIDYLSAEAEWRMCARVQRELLAVRVEFGQAEAKHLVELDQALAKIDPLNISLLEEKLTKHDQLAVLEELGRFVSEETKALLHPGTTSYDVVDTARSYLFQQAWKNCLKPEVVSCLKLLTSLAEDYRQLLQVGRTHLQKTSPVPFGLTLGRYAARIAERMENAELAFLRLKGKVSGIVGTGSSVSMVVGQRRSLEFERRVLERFGLEPDLTATQIVQKESLADLGHALVTLNGVLADFANDMRILYSSEINEVTSREGKKRLGGSSADAGKNNPINWENISGKAAIVESGMRVLYSLVSSDLQRDLRGSVQARYQPQAMIAQVCEAFRRARKALGQLSVNTDRMELHLSDTRKFPSEAMVAILRGHGYRHPRFGVGHDAVKEFSKMAKREEKPLLAVARSDSHFQEFFEKQLGVQEQEILKGTLEEYLGSSEERLSWCLEYVERILKDSKL